MNETNDHPDEEPEMQEQKQPPYDANLARLRSTEKNEKHDTGDEMNLVDDDIVEENDHTT